MAFKFCMKNKSIFLHFLQPMGIFVIIQILIIIGTISFSQLFPRLNQNAKELVDQKVLNRSSYLQNEMLNNWSNLDELTDYINDAAETLKQRGIIDFDTLDDSTANASPLLRNVTEKLIVIMRTHRVNGAYIVLNSKDLNSGLENKPGVYIRDLDPTVNDIQGNTDLIFKRAPIEVVKQLNISTDASWQSEFEFKKNNIDYYDFFYTPFQAALYNNGQFTTKDLGYWGVSYILDGDSSEVITYSLPLINNEGYVYGIVGIDITLDYLNKLLPCEELFEGNKGSYLLALDYGNDQLINNVFANGNTYAIKDKTTLLLGNQGDYYIQYNGKSLYGAMNYLNVYSSNTPYGNQKWSLVGLVGTEYLFAFANKVIFMLIVIVLMILLVGISGSLVASYFISKPIKRLALDVESAKDKPVKFVKTNISEIDHLANTMNQLNQNIQDTSMKFSMILKMASVKLAGFEYNAITDELFLSDNFFEVLANDKIDTYNLSSKKFIRELLKYRKYIVSKMDNPIEYLFKVPNHSSFIFVKLKLIVNDKVYMGVVEDITISIIEKRAIEYERDHDALTGLLNRRAFSRITNELFKNHEAKLKIAALLMLDLDDLKHINDTFGHEMGDRYISIAAKTFKKAIPKDAIISRISGDEFFVFFYGYDSPDEIKVYVNKLKQAILQTSITVAGGKKYNIKASGGVAWYPRDTTSFELLQQYADYAMYKVKHACKGNITNFSSDDYKLDSHFIQAKKELNKIINDNILEFHLQPIVDSHDGTIFAYEALMRSSMPILKSPMDILKVAKEEERLADIELLTWINALKTYESHIKNNYILDQTKIFINSLSNQMLSRETMYILESKYRPYLKNIVLEISEVESVDENYQVQKEAFIKRWHADIALDDYGSGYNSEKTLLLLSPKYIKVDMEIIRGIDSNLDKCKIVENIVNYGHERNMKIIAEGIESEAELKKVIELKVDYLQGFLLAKPFYTPPVLSQKVVEMIKKINKNLK